MVCLKCQQCGAALDWDGRGYVVRCVYCGAEYLMHPRAERLHKKALNIYEGTGRVQGIPIEPGNGCSGLMPIESFAPEGWTVRARQASDEYYGDYRGNPFVVEAEYASPDKSTVILYRGANLYTDRKLSRLPSIKQIDVMGSFLRVGTPFGAEQYCDYITGRDVRPLHCRKIRTEQADQAELEKQRKIDQEYTAQGFTQVASEWKRVLYAVTDQNQKQKVVSVETRINDVHKRPQQMGGMFGAFMGQMFQQDEHYWETQYEFIIVSDREQYNSVIPTARKILETIRELPDVKKIRDSLIQYIQALNNQTAMAMHQQQMTSWDRQSQILRDTHDYTMNVMHEMNANTAATHERVANLHSEAIRGVNTYYNANPGFGNPDIVEASVKWDHVYQSTRDLDIFAASERIWLEPGADFEELRKTNGNY